GYFGPYFYSDGLGGAWKVAVRSGAHLTGDHVVVVDRAQVQNLGRGSRARVGGDQAAVPIPLVSQGAVVRIHGRYTSTRGGRLAGRRRPRYGHSKGIAPRHSDCPRIGGCRVTTAAPTSVRGHYHMDTVAANRQ